MQATYEHIIENYKMQNILVIGDMLSDIYLYGDISRISREAPVLVLLENKKTTVPGGASNVAHNISSLGGKSYPIGIIGDDKEGLDLETSLANGGCSCKYLLRDKNFFTTTKTRIIAGGRATVSQQIVRIDREKEQCLDEKAEEKLLSVIKISLEKADGIILSDYGIGTISPNIREYVIDFANQNNLPLMVDSRYDVLNFKKAAYIKQNDEELASAVKRLIKNEEELLRAAKEFLNLMEAKGVLITRGEKGMLLVEKEKHYFIPVSDKSEVFDVSGAGDTCVATFVTSLAAGSTSYDAAYLSNIASGIAVRKMGTARVFKDELLKAIKGAE